MLGYIFARRVSAGHLVAAAAIGLLIPAGWLITGVLDQDDFDPVPLQSLTFTAPLADSIQYVMTFTGAQINFGIALVFGVVAGSFISAVQGGRMYLVGFEEPEQMVRYLGGAALMGIGSVMSLGCTIGQGLSGVSTLSLASILALMAICAGAAAVLKYQERTSVIRVAMAPPNNQSWSVTASIATKSPWAIRPGKCLPNRMPSCFAGYSRGAWPVCWTGWTRAKRSPDRTGLPRSMQGSNRPSPLEKT